MDTFEKHLNRQIELLYPTISSSLYRIDSIESDVAFKILGELLSFSCQATHHSAIVAGRKAIRSLPVTWLEANLCKAVKAQLNLDDEWEFQRLLELLKDVLPSMMVQFVTTGLSSSDLGIREIAQDYAKGVHGPVEGLGDAGPQR